MKAIVVVPHAVLNKTAKSVTSFDRQLKKLIEDMKDTLLATKNPKGVGLAAPQIGISCRIFITKPAENAQVRTFINPEIISHEIPTEDGEPKKEDKLEGCLSIPTIWGRVKRHPALTLRYQDEDGNTHEETFHGFMATIVQHETDHVNGILFTQRVLEQQGKLYQTIQDKDGKEVLEEINV